METPMFTKRITRSQAKISKVENQEFKNDVLNNKKKCEKHQESERSSALIDITNIGSPIVGLAMGSLKTPSSRCSKKRMIGSNSESRTAMTPGSGESLLRCQVKSLLQKVEEEGVVNFNFTQMLNEVVPAPNQEGEGVNVEKNVITRSLLLDFSEKPHDLESSDCNSNLTCQNSNVSLWSVEVNASTSDEDYEDVLCEGMSKMSVNNAVKFTGKHTRFVYNSDGELEGELLSSSLSLSTTG